MALSIEKAAELGFHLVQDIEDAVKFERVHAAGTQVINAKSVEAGLAAIESFISKFPGIFGNSASRSDGAIESKDVQLQQSIAASSDGPSPAADQAEADAAAQAAAEAAAPAEADQSLVAEAPGEAVTGRADVPPAPEDPAAPEGTVAS